VNVKLVVPEFPSALVTFEIEITGRTGPPEHGFNADAVLRGAGAPTVKSELLLLLSVQPPFLRSAAVVLLRIGVAAPSKKSAPSYPTRSRISAGCVPLQGFVPPLQPRVTAVETKATFPPVADIAIGVASTRSAVGSGAPVPAPAPSWTRKYCPGCNVTLGNSV